MPLINPATGASSRTYVLRGKIDGLAPGYVIEHKTTSESVAPDSDYWLRLRVDPQLAMYVLAARWMGRDVGKVWYNVIKKPTIKPHRATPEDKRKYKKDGTLYANQRTEDETPAEWGDRLAADIASRPEYYYARREIPVLDDQLAEFRADVWGQAKMLTECRRNGYWFRTVGRWSCGYCDYAELCLHSVEVDPAAPPAGFEIVENLHPELSYTQGENYATEDTSATTEPAATVTTADQVEVAFWASP